MLPYAITEDIEQLAELLKCNLPVNADTVKKCNNKIYIRKKLINSIKYPAGEVISGINEATEVLYDLKNREFNKFILKKSYGASGKGSFLIHNEKQLKSIFRHFIKEDEVLLLEGWYDNKTDYSYQIYISKAGTVSLYFMSQQFLDNTIYSGSLFPTNLSNSQYKTIKADAAIIGKELYKLGVRGVVGIDCFFSNNELYASIDVNVRFTLTTYLSNMQNILGYDKTYFSKMYDMNISDRLTYEILLDLLQKNEIEYTKNRGWGVFIYTSGTLPTTVDARSQLFKGRIFLVFIHENIEKTKELKYKFDMLITEI